jgi:hypothetical protein
MEKKLSEMSNDEIRAHLDARTQNHGGPVARRGPIAAPAGLNDPNTGPMTRQHLLETYAGACMDIPPGEWTPGMREAVKEQCLIVLQRGW